MSGTITSPPVPLRTRGRGKHQSTPEYSTTLGSRDSNRVVVQPASPEVISNLITSLSIISTPANDLFENPDTLALSPTPTHRSSSRARGEERYDSSNGEGSFGIDYGAFNQPSLLALPDNPDLNELAATPPVIKTAKPPSGFSVHTAPKSPSKDSSLKSFIRGTSSRPTSKGSNDDASSIGTVSIEPGVPPHELQRQASTDSWGKKQGRNQRGLMYMSSKEKLRDSERKRASVSSAASGLKGLGLDRLPMPSFEADSFMAESPIKEEVGLEPGDSATGSLGSAAVSPSIGGTSPALSSGSGGARFIPQRDSSLRNKSTGSRKRTSIRSSRHDGKLKEIEDGTIAELDEKPEPLKMADRRRRREKQLDVTTKLKEPLPSPPLESPTTLASKQVARSAKVEEFLVSDSEQAAPAPAIGSRASQLAEEDKKRSSLSKDRKNGRKTPDVLAKVDASRLKRLSAGPLSPTSSMEGGKRGSKSGRKSVTSPEPKLSRASVDDRPTSADSIDDAVDSYLCSPRLSQRIRHPQTGRVISFSDVGDPEGHAIFCCVGMGLTRYITAFYDELALTLKLRLITPDRPGVGDSEPYTDGTSTPLSWPDDVYAICQALKIAKFSILAHSAGAIYALATALRMPQHIRGRIHLLAPWIPPSQLNVFGGKQLSPPSTTIPTSQRILRALPTPILKAANSSFMSATSSSITSSLPKTPRRGGKRKSANAPTGRDTPTLERSQRDSTPGLDKENVGPGIATKTTPSSLLELAAANPSDPNHEAAILSAAAENLASKERQSQYDTRLTHAIWDLATSNANPAVDLLVCLERRHTIGFRYVDITRAVVIHHGSKDSRVPVENVKWLGKMMRRCEVRILEGEGHGLMASAGVMGGVLMEISKEWEDWMKVVQAKDGTARRTLRERASVGGFR